MIELYTYLRCNSTTPVTQCYLTWLHNTWPNCFTPVLTLT